MALMGRYQKGIFVAWHGNGMACVNQTRPHCTNQMGNTQSKALVERHGRGMAGERHGMCESAFRDTNLKFARSQTSVDGGLGLRSSEVTRRRLVDGTLTLPVKRSTQN
jgi:hypothetical protein